MSAWLHLRGQGDKSRPRIRQVMQHPYRECIVKTSSQGQMINISLNDMHIPQSASGGKCCFDSTAEIDSDYIFRTPARGKLCVPPLAAAAFEYDLVTEEFGCYRSNPAKKLLGVARVILSEVLPLPAKAGRCCCFVTLNLFRVGKTRDASNDRERGCARVAMQLAFDDFLFLFLRGSGRQFY